MTDLRQAAQQALDALENSSPDQYPEDAGVFYDAITALRTALEQQAEPVYRKGCAECDRVKQVQEADDEWKADLAKGRKILAQQLAAQPQQQAEPVAWDKPSASFNDWWDGDYDDSENPFEQDSAAYWAWAGWQAAQRPWVGLTDEEATKIWESTDDKDSWELLKRVEAKLKEKNDH